MMRLRVFSLMLLLFNQIFCQDLVRLELKNDSPFMPEDQNSVKIYDSKIGLIKEAKIGSIVEIGIYQYPTKLYFYLEIRIFVESSRSTIILLQKKSIIQMHIILI